MSRLLTKGRGYQPLHPTSQRRWTSGPQEVPGCSRRWNVERKLSGRL